MRALNARVIPLQRGFGRRGEHGVQARGVGAELFNDVLRINAVVLGLGHGAHAFVVDQRSDRQRASAAFNSVLEPRTGHLTGVVEHMLDIVWPEVFLAALVSAA